MVELGFGLMRLPLTDNMDMNSIDQEKLNELVDIFLESGNAYFDTSYPYHNGLSESAFKKAVVDRYPRDSFKIMDKLPVYMINNSSEMEEIFNEQLERCGVDYFDYYLLHNTKNWSKDEFTEEDTFDFIADKIGEGKILHFGISTHEDSQFLDELLTNHPEIEFVQLQINYLDWENPSINAKKSYEVARRHGKDVFVMEPTKGGTLANLPKVASTLLNVYNPNSTPAGWALRFCANLDGVKVILSGMNDTKQLSDNINSLKNPIAFNDNELKLLDNVINIINKDEIIPCTGCNYCLSYCPMELPISTYFKLYNDYKFELEFFNAQVNRYNQIITDGYSKASVCTGCNKCSDECPQHIDVASYIRLIADNFEK